MAALPIAPLNECYSCHKKFEAPSIPQENSLVLTVCCYNIFHTKCLNEWVLKNQTCPCRAPMTSEKLGKPFHTMWKTFEITARHYPMEITSTFDKLPSLTEISQDCSTCFESFPLLSLSYLLKEKRLAHTSCIPSNLSHREISVVDLATLIKHLVKKYPELAEKFTNGQQ